MKSTALIILMAVAIIIEIIFTPLFLKAQRPGKCNKSLCFKMICATMFMALGIMAWIYSGNNSEFAKFILIGLAFSWVGDLFLHVRTNGWSFAVGFVSFFIAHIFYIIAYCKISLSLFPDKKLFEYYEIIGIIAVEAILFLGYIFIKKMSFKSPGMIASAVYGIVLNTMLVKSVTFCIRYIAGGFPNAVIGGLLVAIGGFSFWMSDTSLVPLTFNEKDKHNVLLKNHNIGTYFFAQTLLALSILFIGV